MASPGQTSLYNFYQSVKFRSPHLATLMSDDIIIVALDALMEDNTKGQEAADRLRHTSRDLPEVLRRVLDSALLDLGYSDTGVPS